MSAVVMLSGPIGAGKTTVAKTLVEIWPGPLAYIEGDRFWSFLIKPAKGDPRARFAALIRSMTAAALPLARSGHDVLIDFSTPPAFIPVARRILRETPLDFVMLRPPLAVCAARAAARPVGAIRNYDEGFYALFEAAGVAAEADISGEPRAIAEHILAGLAEGRFRVTGPSA